MFNAIQKNQQKLDKEQADKRMARVIPLARKVIAIIGKHAETIPLGDVDSSHAGYREIAREIMQMFLDENACWYDKTLILQVALQAFTSPKDIVEQSFDHSWQTILSGLFGKNLPELTFKEVDEALVKGQKIEEVAPETKE